VEKQILLADKLKKRLDSGVILTVGAAFDFLAGIKKQCPVVIRNIGGEWLFRWLSEPRRLSKRYFKILKFYISQGLKNK
jgi:N-acetylglucosaminyldiphosphoundecaprenol N-acetyl-beta-D-mannosaminyltransferase